MNTITLTEEKETLLIPLVCKAEEAKRKRPLIVDTKAAEIIDQIDYDFVLLKIPEKTCRMICLRATLMDNFVAEFLQANGDSVALHLGCGLDARYERIGDAGVDWYDIDFPEVIDLRRSFFAETDRYHMIPSSVTETAWLERIPQGRRHYIVIAEGLFMYLSEDEIRSLISGLEKRIGSFTLIFDAFSTLTAKKIHEHPSIQKTGATVKWGIDDPEELTRWGPQIRFVKEEFFTSNRELEKLDAVSRVIFRISDLLPPVRRAQRILVYTVGMP
jgi:O-methyltransferase involved in polyketide biosynthesis